MKTFWRNIRIKARESVGILPLLVLVVAIMVLAAIDNAQEKRCLADARAVLAERIAIQFVYAEAPQRFSPAVAVGNLSGFAGYWDGNSPLDRAILQNGKFRLAAYLRADGKWEAGAHIYSTCSYWYGNMEAFTKIIFSDRPTHRAVEILPAVVPRA